MRKLLSNNSFLVLSAVFVGVAGFIISFVVRDFMWFARFGSLIVAIGIILLSQATILNIDVSLDVLGAETDLSLFSEEYYARVNEPVPEWVPPHRAARFALGVLGPAVTGIGTIVWGFGDLLNILFHMKT